MYEQHYIDLLWLFHSTQNTLWI